MRGTITRRGESWLVRAFVGRTETGKQKFLHKTVRGSRPEAENELAKLLVEAQRLRDRHEYSTPESDTLAAWLSLWLKSRRKRISEHTRVTYERAVRLHIMPTIGHYKLRQITGTTLTVFYSDLPLAGKTVQVIHGILHSALRQAQRDGLIADNPADFCELPKVADKQVAVPSHDDIARVLEVNVGRWEATAILVMVAAGLRRGEAVGLCWRDIDFDQGTLRIERNVQTINRDIVVLPPKSRAGRRQVAIPAALVAHLKDYRRWQREEFMRRGIRSEDDICFPSRHGGLRKPSTFGAAIAAAGERARVHLTPHMLRHRFGTDMLKGRINPRIAQARLGHARVATTQQVYQHVIEDAQQDAADLAGEVLNRLL